jgi:glycosyltransferase involved in cell wall biosynthesis
LSPKALIITYYWPPSGGSAVLRWVKFSKYLRDFGWEPVIYTPANPEPQETDVSLLKDIPDGIEIIKTSIIEPYGIYKWLTGRKQSDRLGVAMMSGNKKAGLMSRISLWIRSNLFIPDPRMLWIRPSVRYLRNYIRLNPVDVIITSGPPHSMHLIGMHLSEKTGIPWVADFRDPWTNIDFYRDLKLTGIAHRYHRKLERKVLQSAHLVLTVSPTMTEEFRLIGGRQVVTLTNGFDTEPMPPSMPDADKFILVHLGSVPSSRNPESLWIAISELVKISTAFASKLQIRLTGKVDLKVSEAISQYHLEPYTLFENFVPHSQTPKLLGSASVLLLLINNTPNAKGILTNKFFEYLATGKPVLAIGPVDGDAAQILKETGAGEIIAYNDVPALQLHLLKLFELYSKRQLNKYTGNIEKYTRKHLTGELTTLLNRLIH